MQRFDHNLPFLLRYENVAWFEGDRVRVLDRRVYPTEIRFVTCHDPAEVAQAIADMVTQSAGPYTLAGMGMALAAKQAAALSASAFEEALKKASDAISNARPTTKNRMSQITQAAYDCALTARSRGDDPAEAVFLSTIESLNRRYSRKEEVGKHLLPLLPQDPKEAVLTQCFGETIVGMMLRLAKEQQRNFRLICAETRPYLQGAKLTASCGVDMGFDTTVISDNMVAYAMQQEPIRVFTSAADSIARDGHIANKVGTYQIAILAQHHEIPYFVTGIPDQDKHHVKDIVIEQRDPELVMRMHGIKHVAEGVKALYPSFDITPPSLISGVVTDKGVFSPYDLARYFDSPVQRFY